MGEEFDSANLPNMIATINPDGTEVKTNTNEVSSLRLTEFPEPDFVGEGILGIDGNTYYQKIDCEGTPIHINDAVLILTDDKQYIRKDFMYCGRILRFWRTPDDKRRCLINWYQRREEVPQESKPFLLQRELLLTEKTDTIPVDSIKTTIKVYESPEALGPIANVPVEVLTDEFFCNRGFLVSRLEFVALSTITRLMKQTEDVIERVEGFSKYDMAKARLQLSNVQSVAGRVNEIDKISKTLVRFLNQKGRGDCLYISGVPGTGKTLCVREVMKQLARDQLNADVLEFDFYEVNCLRLESPKEIFVEMWRQMAGEKLNSIAAQRALNDVFTNDPPQNYIILLVDEVDVLLTNQQNELYCLLEWAGLPKSHFIIICIANLMDLDARLKPKLASRFGKTAVKFYPYKYDELKEIINSRVGELDVFEDSAIEYCSKQIANYGGDARKALEACKRALDLIPENNCDNNGQLKKVALSNMTATIRELQATRSLTLLSKISEQQQIFLTAFLMDMRLTTRTVIPVRDVCRRHKIIQSQLEVKFPISQQAMLVIANQLVEMHIIKGIKETNVHENSTITLMCMEHDALQALNKEERFARFIGNVNPV